MALHECIESSFKFLGIYAYVTLKENATITQEQLQIDLRDIVKKRIGSFAAPERFQVWL